MGQLTKQQKFAMSFSRHANGRFSRKASRTPYHALETEGGSSDASSSAIMVSSLQDAPADELFIIEKIWAKKLVENDPFFLSKWVPTKTYINRSHMSPIIL